MAEKDPKEEKPSGPTATDQSPYMLIRGIHSETGTSRVYSAGNKYGDHADPPQNKAEQNEADVALAGHHTPPKEMASPSSFKHGGTVEKTGLALVHKGEKVIPKEQNMHDTYGLAKDGMSGGESAPEKKIKHIITRRVHGGHVHTHVHTHPFHPDEEHVTQGTDGMIDHMMEHNAEPNPGEAEADMGQSGIPPAGGAPAPSAGPVGA